MHSHLLDIERPARPTALAATGLTGIFMGGFVGATANAINGAVSPHYFVMIMRWQNVENVWQASVAQGTFEGLIFGFFFALIFTIATGIITRAACTYRFAAKHLLGIVIAIYVCWLIGGLIAMGLATLSPAHYRRAFIGVPDAFGDMLGYAWVGGSIFGAQFGGLLCTVIGLFFLRANWRRERMIEESQL